MRKNWKWWLLVPVAPLIAVAFVEAWLWWNSVLEARFGAQQPAWGFAWFLTIAAVAITVGIADERGRRP